MILNKSNFLCLHDDGSFEYDSKPKVTRYHPFMDQGKDYWYIEILYTYKSTQNPPIKRLEDHIPSDILAKIRTGDVTLLILGIEPVTEVVDDVYRFIHNCQIPEGNVELVTELVDIKERLDLVGLNVKTYLINLDEHAVAFQLKKNLSYFENSRPLSNTTFTKSFINLNRRWRIHRPLFVSLLASHNLLDKGYVSLGDTKESDITWDSMFQSLLNIVDDDTKSLLMSNKEKIVGLPELLVDTNRLDVNLADLCLVESTKKFYEETYFSIVTETCFFDDVGRFATEKLFKPIAHRHPFLALAPPGTLDFLRDRGYKTFHPCIDESYDTITDNMARMKLVLNETERLANLSESELQTFINNVEPIVEHNFNVLQHKADRDFIIG